jgi:transposase, IS30 family
MCRLSFYERQLIESMYRRGVSKRGIGRRMRRDHSVIVREINRNKNMHKRIRLAKRCKLEKNLKLRTYVLRNLRRGRSPDVIAGVLRKQAQLPVQERISHESIYRYIYTGPGRYEYLYPYLASGRAKRRKHRTRRTREITIKHRVSIHERPAFIQERKELGHWESDSMIFRRQRDILSVQVERKSRFVRITKLPNKTAEETLRALTSTLTMLSPNQKQTLTFDNGTEGAFHYKLTEEYGVHTFFCDPYKSWQKGSVERVNRQIRRFLPRKTNLSAVQGEEIQQIEDYLNDLPRKSLNYRTPRQVLEQGGALVT